MVVVVVVGGGVMDRKEPIFSAVFKLKAPFDFLQKRFVISECPSWRFFGTVRPITKSLKINFHFFVFEISVEKKTFLRVTGNLLGYFMVLWE